MSGMQVPLLDRTGAPARVGTVRAHLGDWRSAWWLWPEGCVLITDPPFGQNYRSGHTNEGWAGKRDGVERSLATSVAGDADTRERDEALDQPWLAAAVWGPRRLDKIPPWGDPIEVLVHDKKGVGMGDLSIPWKPSWETIAIYGEGWAGKRTEGVLQGAVVPFGRGSASNGRIHPNEKPLNVCAELVMKSPACLEVPIVDPFAGSFSIPLAAAMLGLDVYASEIDERHYTRGVARLRSNGVNVIEG
jgi:site-specific DNA-methyltransferase (adenine-specific)